MRVVARRRKDFAHDVEIEGGKHRLLIDEPVEAGGEDAGPAPTRLVAAGLAGCVAITMEMYAKRKGWELGQVEVTVDVEYDRFIPRSFAVAIQIPAELDDEQREAMLKVAGKCPVHRVLSQGTDVAVSYRIEES
jgi:putative redox protein